ncbi:MAG: glycosyltransferase family 4 protein [Anaerolineaceae bacterium]|nr:glycosyltransferase family 4 protein [Anaerolineaceae bacterium]
MRVLIALTYYRPHYSGLTIYTERLAGALAARGHQVTVLTSRFDPRLPPIDRSTGVEIVRPSVWMRVSKGVLMPSMLWHAWRLMRQADIVNLHVPQLDAGPIALLARLMGKPVVLTYHCDLLLPNGLVHGIANQVSHLVNQVSAHAADMIVTNTRDYAEHSPFLRRFLGKMRIIPPPVALPLITTQDLRDFRCKYEIEDGQIIIGMAARLATEKGVEYLIEALPGVLKRYPTARVLFVGQYQNVLGEEQYAAMLAPLIRDLGGHWSFLGVIPPIELTAFYRTCAVTVLPSINGTESFGMVQVEAMTCGTPVVASDIPGVRQPVLSSGMGRIVPPRSAASLEKALIEILDQRDEFRGNAQMIARRYAPDTIAKEYEDLFRELIAKK